LPTSGKGLLSKETPGTTQESLGTPRMLRTARTHRESQDKINNFRITQDILRITQDSLRIYSGHSIELSELYLDETRRQSIYTLDVSLSRV